MTRLSPSLPFLVSTLFLAACGSGATGGDPVDGGSNTTTDAGTSTDAGTTTEGSDAGTANEGTDAGTTSSTKASVRYAFLIDAPPADRTSVAVTLDGQPLADGVDAALLTATSAYFLPGTTDKWLEITAGTHEVKITVNGKTRRCNDPSCEDFTDDPFAATKTVSFTAAGGTHWTATAAVRLVFVGPRIPLVPEAHALALQTEPNETDTAVSVFRWPSSLDDDKDWNLTATTKGTSTVVRAALKPAEGVVVKVPPNPVRLLVQWTNSQGQLVTKGIDLPTNLAPGDVMPILWMGTSPQGPMLTSGPGGYYPFVNLQE